MKKEEKFLDALCRKDFDPGQALKDLNGGEFEQVDKPELTGREVHQAYVNSNTVEEFAQYFNTREEAVNIWYELEEKFKNH
jgi:hypothetical protein